MATSLEQRIATKEVEIDKKVSTNLSDIDHLEGRIVTFTSYTPGLSNVGFHESRSKLVRYLESLRENTERTENVLDAKEKYKKLHEPTGFETQTSETKTLTPGETSTQAKENKPGIPMKVDPNRIIYPDTPSRKGRIDHWIPDSTESSESWKIYKQNHPKYKGNPPKPKTWQQFMNGN